MMERKKLNDVFTPDNGVFANLQTYDVPWADNDIATILDSEYHYNIAGMREVSPLVLHKLANAEQLTPEARADIANIIYSLYSMRWAKLWATMQFEYNPIENYDMEEKLTGDREQTTYGKTDTFTHGHSETLTHATTDTLNHGHSETLTHDTTEAFSHGHSETLTHATTDTLTHNTDETITHNTTDTRTPALNTETENTIQGFNSSTYQPDTKTETSETGTDTTTHTGTDSTRHTGTESTQRTGTDTTAHTGTDTTKHTGTDTTAHTGTDTTQHTGTDTTAHTGQDTNTAGGNDVKTHEYTLTRHGNIGVTTSQQMIESERALWMWQFFYDVVFPDVNRVLTLSIY